MSIPARFHTVIAAVLLLAAGGWLSGCEAPKQPAPTPAPTPAATPKVAPATSPAPAVESRTVSMRQPAGLPAPEGTVPAHGDTLYSRLPVEFKDLNPLNTPDAYAQRAVNYIFDSLLWRNPVTLALEPHVAEAWESAPDHLSYTFTLREGVTFSDGQPLTVDDVKFTYDTMMDPKTDCPDLRNYYQDVTACEVLDAKTVRFTCSKPFFLHEIMLGELPVLPKHVYSTFDFNDSSKHRKPVGSGPYLLEAWETNQQVTFTRNKNYWADKLGRGGHIDKLVWRIVTDDNAALQMALRGELDTIGLMPKDWVGVATTPEFEGQFNKLAYDTPAFWYMGWNQRKPFFADKRVRRAMTLLLDRETIREKILHGLAEQLTASFIPGTDEYDPALTPLPFDPAAAAALLDEAGWKDTNGNGIRDKDGVEFKFEILLPTKAEEWEQFATIHQEELKRQGIEMTLRAIEWASMLELVDKRNFDSVILGWSMTPDPDMYQIWHSSQTEKGSNYVGFNVPEADKIIEDYRASFDRDERVKLCRRFHQILYDEQPYTFLFAPKALLGVSKRVENAVIYPIFRTRPNLEWFVPVDRQKYK